MTADVIDSLTSLFHDILEKGNHIIALASGSPRLSAAKITTDGAETFSFEFFPRKLGGHDAKDEEMGDR